MDYKIKRIGSYKVEAAFTFGPEEIEDAFQEAYKKARSSIKFDGFRKGKAPLEIVEKALGNSVIEDVADNLITKLWMEHFEVLDPAPINLPLFSIEKLTRHKSALIKCEYETKPVFKLPKYKKIKITQDIPVVPERLIDERLDQMREEEALLRTREEGELVEAGDDVLLALSLRDGETIIYETDDFEIKDIGSEKITPSGSSVDLATEVIGLRVGSEKTIEIPYPPKKEGEEESQDDQERKLLPLVFKVREAQYKELPELSDEFAKDVGNYESLADLREKLKKELLERGQRQIEEQTQRTLLSRLITDAGIEVPPSMKEKALDSRLESLAAMFRIQFPQKQKTIKKTKGKRKKKASKQEPLSTQEKLDYLSDVIQLDRSTMEKDLGSDAERMVCEHLILLAIVEKEQIQPGEDEIKKAISNYYTAKYGRLDDAAMEVIYKDKEVWDDILFQLQLEQAKKFVFDHASIKKGKEVAVDKIGDESDT